MVKRRYRRTLTSHYAEIMRLYRSGYGYTRIGQMLDLHPVTVGNYVRSLLPPAERRPRGYQAGLAPRKARRKKC